MDTEDRKVENVNEIAKMLTDDLNSKVSEDVKDFIKRKKLNLKCDLNEDADFIKNVEVKEIKSALKNEKYGITLANLLATCCGEWVIGRRRGEGGERICMLSCLVSVSGCVQLGMGEWGSLSSFSLFV